MSRAKAVSVRSAGMKDLASVLNLYSQLKEESLHAGHPGIQETFARIVADKNRRIFLVQVENEAVAACEVAVLPNLTHGARPYAVVENVVTNKAHRRQGYASIALKAAGDFALKAGCYKIMLMTGSKEPGVLDFYEKAGYNQNDKTAFVQWL